MQKKLIALAIAGLASGAAFAQTNVTVYGVADASYVYADGDGGAGQSNKTFSGISSGMLSGSRIGFKGEEALGNGLKAVFTLEYYLTIDENTGVGSTGGLNARQQFVGLSSDKLGTVALGRQYAPGYIATVNNDAFEGAIFSPQSVFSAQAGNSITPNSGARYNNAATYTSPNWSGFTAKAIYSFGEDGVTNPTTQNGKFGLGGNYSNGPINIDLVYQGTTDKNPLNTNPLNQDKNNVYEYYVGGSYDLKMVKVMGSYQKQNDKSGDNNDNKIWTVGAVIPVMAASQVRLTYAELDNDQGNVATMYNGKSKAGGIALTHSLSKRTTLYAGYVYIKNDADSRPTSVAGVGNAGEHNQTVVAGVRHTF